MQRAIMAYRRGDMCLNAALRTCDVAKAILKRRVDGGNIKHVLLLEERFWVCGANHVGWRNLIFLVVLIEEIEWLGIKGTTDSFRAILKSRWANQNPHRWQGQRVSRRNMRENFLQILIIMVKSTS
jgi:hypothetical protein